ncbi:MAG TPA: dihydroneopterin aldolase [Paludibacteraceae bacterium]|nr:dihydroneopterin aldolase [Paludibacteraceae bacterium]
MQILLENMKFFAFHGAIPEERIVGCTYTVTVKMDVDFSEAVKTDDLNGTINYADVFNLVKEEMKKPSNLIEHVAQRILDVIKKTYPQVEALEVRVSKHRPPVAGDMERATVVVNG